MENEFYEAFMKRSRSIFWKAALGAALFSLLPATGFAADVPSVTVVGTLTAPLRAPGKMALDSKRVLYVADTQNRGIVKFDTRGGYLALLPIPGVVRSVACTADDRIVVSHDSSVSLYTTSGTWLGALSGYSFLFPNGIATDPAGNFYVADSKANKVAVFDRSGAFVSAFGVKGNGAGEFNYPTALAWEGASGQLAVADTLNNRVQFFDTAGAFKRSVGTPSKLSGPLKFTYPQGIAFDYQGGVRMYVADAFQSSVQVVDLGTLPRFLSYIGAYGLAAGELQRPSDVLYDAATAELLVCDSTGKINIYGISAAAAAGSTGGTGSAVGQPAAGSTDPAVTGAGGGDGSGPVTATSPGNPGWQYPAGVDCRHARAGSMVCRD